VECGERQVRSSSFPTTVLVEVKVWEAISVTLFGHSLVLHVIQEPGLHLVRGGNPVTQPLMESITSTKELKENFPGGPTGGSFSD
jgi:hypothetical protein